jgi:hypothetical protein
LLVFRYLLQFGGELPEITGDTAVDVRDGVSRGTEFVNGSFAPWRDGR